MPLSSLIIPKINAQKLEYSLYTTGYKGQNLTPLSLETKEPQSFLNGPIRFWPSHSSGLPDKDGRFQQYDKGTRRIVIYIQQYATLHSLFFFLETALHVSGGTPTHHQERKQLYLQHLVFVTPLLLSAAIVEELELVW